MPLGAGVIVIAVLTCIEFLASLIVQDWINVILQGVLMIVFLVTICRRHQES